MKKILLLISLSLSIFLVSCGVEKRELTNEDMNNLVQYMNWDIIQEINEEFGSCTKKDYITHYIEKDNDFQKIYNDYCKKENIK